jgi:hypothetical protein
MAIVDYWFVSCRDRLGIQLAKQTDKLLSRSEFFECLVRLAGYKYRNVVKGQSIAFEKVIE